MESDSRTLSHLSAPPAAGGPAPLHVGLVVVWSAEQPELLGALLLPNPTLGAGPWVIGRGDSPPQKGRGRRLLFRRQRPHEEAPQRVLLDRHISHDQLELWGLEGGLGFKRIGKRACLLNRAVVEEGRIGPGDLLEVEGRLLLLAVRRPLQLDWPVGLPPWAPFEFGGADAAGMVGESLALWALRREIAARAREPWPVWIQGPSGSGKERVVRALHALSDRSSGPLLTENAAALPQNLVEAELFGYVDGAYTGARRGGSQGLVGRAQGGTLLLDEFPELPVEVQAKLLRLMETRDYRRVGGDRTLHSDARIVVAGHHSSDRIKPDILGRLGAPLKVPGLEERREDIPLLLAHLGREALREMGEPSTLPPPTGLDELYALLVGPHPQQIRGLIEAIRSRRRGSAGAGEGREASPARPRLEQVLGEREQRALEELRRCGFAPDRDEGRYSELNRFRKRILVALLVAWEFDLPAVVAALEVGVGEQPPRGATEWAKGVLGKIAQEDPAALRSPGSPRYQQLKEELSEKRVKDLIAVVGALEIGRLKLPG